MSDAYDEIMRLVRKHRLGFLHNPGGGEFTLPRGGSIQVPNMGDADEDLRHLLNGLRESGLEVAATEQGEPK